MNQNTLNPYGDGENPLDRKMTPKEMKQMTDSIAGLQKCKRMFKGLMAGFMNG